MSDYPGFVCSVYNDQFLLLMDPAPAGVMNGNVAPLADGQPIGLNTTPFDSCSPSTGYTCPKGRSALSGTVFDTSRGPSGGAAYGWHTAQAPVTPGQEFTLRFVIYDASDRIGDSTVLLDAFKWIIAQ